ncbi:hypothetical protein [uncultured Prevotella sp.]|uniref:hypothetical protein n=1 Tax=uncultured Prevotella sp. TaxID=159272 RepID=UPI002594EB7F|nr:hypothetical protein [uncultured Prevotella sp.]
MKNIFRKFTPMLMAALAVVALAGCAADDEDFTPGTADNGAYLYASSTNVTYGPDDQQVLKINVGRMDSTTEQTFNLSGDNDAFQVPSSVSFAPGQTSKEVDIPFSLEIGESQTVDIALPSDQKSNYGLDTLRVTVLRDYNWLSAGSGMFIENTFTGDSGTVAVQHADGTDIYRLVQPLKKMTGLTSNLQFTMDANGNVGFKNGLYDIFAGYSKNQGLDYLYYSDKYPDYCSFTNNNGVLELTFLLSDGSSLSTGGDFIFKWNKGYPVQSSFSESN